MLSILFLIALVCALLSGIYVFAEPKYYSRRCAIIAMTLLSISAISLVLIAFIAGAK